MASNGNLQWKDAEIYHPDQVESVLTNLHINISTETDTNFLCLCPYHTNTDTPAMSVEKTAGVFLCFAPHCGESGNLMRLVQDIGSMNYFQARRFINKYHKDVDLEALVARNLIQEPEWKEFPQEVLDKLKKNFPQSRAHDYMRTRGFEWETLDYFDVGYSMHQKMVTVPMHNPQGVPIGLIGRSTEGKAFKNSPGLPKSKTAWNFHRAKKVSDTVIIVESSFDAMRVHQAGFPNVVALLGGFISKYHANQLGKAFSKIIIMTDADEAGRTLAASIESKMSDKQIMYAADSPDSVYPGAAKDASDLDDRQIRYLIKNAVNMAEYASWYN